VGLPSGPCSPCPHYLTVWISYRWAFLLAPALLTHYLTVWSSCRKVCLLAPAPPHPLPDSVELLQVGLPAGPCSPHPLPDSVELLQVGLPAGPSSSSLHYLKVWSSCRWVYLLVPAPPPSTT
jgi:hypothetical protein